MVTNQVLVGFMFFRVSIRPGGSLAGAGPGRAGRVSGSGR